MDFESMNAIQRRLHNAACVLGADGDEYGFEQLQRDAIQEIARLEAALKRANDQAEHFLREWYLRGDAIESALPAMREYVRKNPKHHFSTDGTEQDPNGAHAWLERNEMKPNDSIK
jgi:cob(I)alamin adenosyltransferase